MWQVQMQFIPGNDSIWVAHLNFKNLQYPSCPASITSKGSSLPSSLPIPLAIQFNVFFVISNAAQLPHLEVLASSTESNFHISALACQNLLLGSFGFKGPYPYSLIAFCLF